jgi:hypothetical protein
MVKKAEPGISRAERIADVSLERLEKQLESGVNISSAVLAQWIKRYGDSARRIIKKHHCYREAFDRIK